MKVTPRLLLTTALLMLLIVSSLSTRAHAFTNGQRASLVIGQPDFVTRTAGSIGKTGLYEPMGVTFDSGGNLWVGDLSNNRILEFKPPFIMGMGASLVIGQKDFTTSFPATSEDGLLDPSAVAFDSSGNMWAADFDNARVLEFQPPFATGMRASLVIGQQDLASSTPATTQSGLNRPVWLGFDSAGNLWVTDISSNRILEFNPPFATGMPASLVIGQTDFTQAISDTTRGGFILPYELAFDASSNLWVADYGNNRVLEFEPPFSTGMSSSLVIGQKDFTARISGVSADELQKPGGVAFDSSGNLWVLDNFNNRVLEFSSTAVPEFPTASLAIIAVVSLAVVGVVTRRFSMPRPGRWNPKATYLPKVPKLWQPKSDGLAGGSFRV